MLTKIIKQNADIFAGLFLHEFSRSLEESECIFDKTCKYRNCS